MTTSGWIGYYEFTKDDVLAQINDAPGHLNRTAYVNIRVLQSRKVKSRMNTRRAQVVGRVSRLLNNLAAEGCLTKHEDHSDGLGYEWNLTDIGRVVKEDILKVHLSPRLRKCPFCASKPYPHIQNTSTSVSSGSGYKQVVWCQECGVSGPERDSESDAIKAWNYRPVGEEF